MLSPRSRIAVLMVAAVAGCTGTMDDSPAAEGPDAGALNDDPIDQCELYADKVCVDGDVYWTDSCGGLLEVADECADDSPCTDVAKRCCSAFQASGPSDSLSITHAVTWTFPNAGAVLDIPLELTSVPGGEVDNFFGAFVELGDVTVSIALHIGVIADHSERGALISGVAAPERFRASGDSYRVTSPSGAPGVALDYDWQEGPLVLRLARAPNLFDEPDDWFDFFLVDEGVAHFVGGFSVPRTVANVPETLPPEFAGFHTFLEFDDYANVPTIAYTQALPAIDGVEATAGSLVYGTFSNANVVFDSSSSKLHVEAGASTARCDPEGRFTVTD